MVNYFFWVPVSAENPQQLNAACSEGLKYAILKWSVHFMKFVAAQKGKAHV